MEFIVRGATQFNEPGLFVAFNASAKNTFAGATCWT
jgi:hypothetical protein